MKIQLKVEAENRLEKVDMGSLHVIWPHQNPKQQAPTQ